MEREHYLIGYRKRGSGASKFSFDHLDKDAPDKLYQAVVDYRNPRRYRLNRFFPAGLSDLIQRKISEFSGESDRRNVLLYVHGYIPQIFANFNIKALSLQLLTKKIKAYSRYPDNQLGKTIYFIWPAQGRASRKFTDDRAHEAGREFTEKGLWQEVESLCRTLHEEGIHTHLLVHSYGHHLLNGMLAPIDVSTMDSPVFRNAFLMASDIPQQSVEKSAGDDYENNGVSVSNYHCNDSNCRDIRYNLTKLEKIADSVNVFHDPYDILLYHSAKKQMNSRSLKNMSVGQRREYIRPYLTLGNRGKQDLISFPQNFHFYDVNDYSRVPALPAKRRRRIQQRLEDWKFWKFRNLSIILNGVFGGEKSYTARHRYFMTAGDVVGEVQGLMGRRPLA